MGFLSFVVFHLAVIMQRTGLFPRYLPYCKPRPFINRTNMRYMILYVFEHQFLAEDLKYAFSASTLPTAQSSLQMEFSIETKRKFCNIWHVLHEYKIITNLLNNYYGFVHDALFAVV
jgi:hypothetical protein